MTSEIVSFPSVRSFHISSDFIAALITIKQWNLMHIKKHMKGVGFILLILIEDRVKIGIKFRDFAIFNFAVNKRLKDLVGKLEDAQDGC